VKKTLVITEGSPVEVDGITIVLQSRGHRVTAEGDRNLADIGLTALGKTIQHAVSGDGFNRVEQMIASEGCDVFVVNLTDGGTKALVEVERHK
jgi:hypothetical protein